MSYTESALRGEPGKGKWSIVVKDTVINEHNGSFTDWKLTLWGECIDSSKQELLPMPTEEDDNDHDVISASVSTTTVNPGAEETGLPANPSDHIDRPVNAKPTTGAPSRPAMASTTSAAASTTSTASASATPTSKGTFLPHYFPTFGVSKRTQIWIYGALAIIILFCAGLGAYFFVQRRRRIRNSRDAYEFAALDNTDANSGANGAAGGRRPKRRAGELYDAFAGESDEELLSESEAEDEKTYRDDDAEDEDRGRQQSRADQGEK